jgi:hypothetical protein
MAVELSGRETEVAVLVGEIAPCMVSDEHEALPAVAIHEFKWGKNYRTGHDKWLLRWSANGADSRECREQCRCLATLFKEFCGARQKACFSRLNRLDRKGCAR